MPVADVRYEPDHRGMRRHMMSTATLEPAMMAAADIMANAIASSPSAKLGDKGDGVKKYRESFSVEPITVTIADGPYSNPRRAAQVVNNSDYAAALEFGANATPRPQGGSAGRPQRILGNAAFGVGEYRGGAAT